MLRILSSFTMWKLISKCYFSCRVPVGLLLYVSLPDPPRGCVSKERERHFYPTWREDRVGAQVVVLVGTTSHTPQNCPSNASILTGGPTWVRGRRGWKRPRTRPSFRVGIIEYLPERRQVGDKDFDRFPSDPQWSNRIWVLTRFSEYLLFASRWWVFLGSRNLRDTVLQSCLWSV